MTTKLQAINNAISLIQETLDRADASFAGDAVRRMCSAYEIGGALHGFFYEAAAAMNHFYDGRAAEAKVSFESAKIYLGMIKDLEEANERLSGNTQNMPKDHPHKEYLKEAKNHIVQLDYSWFEYVVNSLPEEFVVEDSPQVTELINRMKCEKDPDVRSALKSQLFALNYSTGWPYGRNTTNKKPSE